MSTVMSTTITVPLSTLRAVALFAATKDVRHFVNGVFIDPAGALVATDGNRLITHELGEPSPLPPTIVPIDAIKAALKAGRNSAMIRIAADQLVVHTKSGNITILYTTIDGTYVNWRRIAESAKNAEAARPTEGPICFHWPYLADCQTAFDLVVEGKPCKDVTTAVGVRLTLTGTTAAIATCSAAPGTVCYVMPKRH